MRINLRFAFTMLLSILFAACSSDFQNPNDPGVITWPSPINLELDGGNGSEPDGKIPYKCTPDASQKAVIEELFTLLNQYRIENSLNPLSYNHDLGGAEQAHCKHMHIHPFFGHTAPDGEPASIKEFWDRAILCGTTALAENIAMGQNSASAVMTTWKDSPGHNQNMLLPNATRVGLGYYENKWGQLFGD